ncbi:MAG TPA: hypothetical protein VG838_17005 [Opitutaceae bacterium]|nr:hypothetical protein [Opitutaceae bacterium]
MTESSSHDPGPLHHRILTSYSRQQLEAKVLELMREGWQRLGDIAVAKPVAATEPPYLTQMMVKISDSAEEG